MQNLRLSLVYHDNLHLFAIVAHVTLLYPKYQTILGFLQYKGAKMGMWSEELTDTALISGAVLNHFFLFRM